MPVEHCRIRTYTHASACHQQEARFTDTFEAAVLVDTQPVQTHVSDQALILV